MAELKRNMKTRISSSRLSGVERRLASDMQSSEGGASTQPTSVKSEISVETHLPLRNGSHESHNAAESSCSNSLPVVLPISLSNQSYHETSKEAHLLRNCGSSMDSFNERSPEEPITASSESGISAQIAIKNANSTKVSAMAGKSCVSYDNSDSFNCTKTAESTHCREKTDEISREAENAKSVTGFDLNEDINTNTMDDCIQPVGETVSSHNVIHVVAKAAVLIGHPRIPLKFEGGLGWKGSAETSAFRPAKNSARSMDDVPKDGFDLNVALVDDNEAFQVDSKQTERPSFDLNCLYDASDEFTPPNSENRVDLSLNSLTSVAEKSHRGNKISDSFYPPRQDFDYLSNSKNTRHLGTGYHIGPGSPPFLQQVALMQRAASYKDPFHFAAGSMPYSRFYGNAPHHEQNTSHTAGYIPNFFDMKTEGSSPSGGNARQFPFLAKSSPIGQHMQHQEAWYAASTKRKEPEGGLECYQLGYKQLL